MLKETPHDQELEMLLSLCMVPCTWPDEEWWGNEEKTDRKAGVGHTEHSDEKATTVMEVQCVYYIEVGLSHVDKQGGKAYFTQLDPEDRLCESLKELSVEE